MKKDDKTYEEKGEEIKKAMRREKLGISISGMPAWLWREFIEDAKQNFSDCYWAKLLDMRNKSLAFEMLQSQGYIEPQQDAGEEPEQLVDEEDNSVYTFTGKVQ